MNNSDFNENDDDRGRQIRIVICFRDNEYPCVFEC